jgi:hypothetical protein
MKTPRGIRNNNPGNIRYNKANPIKWLGLDTPPSDGAFCRFVYAKYGIRALAKLLLNYQDKYGLDTIRKIINRYAPDIENDTEAYVKYVSNDMGIGADVVISVYTPSIMEKLIKAIIKFENGIQPYSDEQICEGIRLL